jgi:uncharacterized protein (DUF4415 family)
MSKKMRDKIKALAELPDEKIDLSDIPEIKSFDGWIRGRFYRPVKKPVTVRMDADVLSWLKSEGDGYQTRMNQILRSAMMQRTKQRKRAS